MGDRATIEFTSEKAGYPEGNAPTIYLHWDGHRAVDLLREGAGRMRGGDPVYAAARFCGHCHNAIEGALSLGIALPGTREDWDAGHFIVDVDTGEVHSLKAGCAVETLELYGG